MSVNVNDLTGKLNFVLSSRKFKEKEYIQDHPILPQSREEEEEVIKEMVFSFIKKLFVGCKIRTNANSFSLRLDGHIHRKANKIREIYNNETEWRNWFENNHSRLYRIMRENRRSFEGGVVDRQVRDGKAFLYIGHRPNNIYSYVNTGLLDFTNWLENEYKRDQSLSEIYDEVLSLMEAEIERKEREKRERIEKELREFTENVMKSLFKPIAPLQESEDAVDRLFAQKFSEYARQHGIAPEYAMEAKADTVVPVGLKVKIMAPPTSEEEGWISLPPFEGYVEPEGYEMQGWGKVTSVDMTSDRSRQGQSPIVVQEYIYTEFNLDHWKHLLPENHAELLEVSKRIRREAQAEIEPFLEQERIQKEAEEQRKREAEEARRIAQEEERRLVEEQIRRQVEQQEATERRRLEAQEQEAIAQRERDARSAERRRELAEQLRQQLTAQPAEEVEEAEEDVPVTAEPERATTEGLYLNSRAIPLERYVGIRSNGSTRRFYNASQAVEWLGYAGAERIEIRDYHVPHNVVDVYSEPETEEFPF